MADPRAKGQRAEYDVRDLLRETTNLQWERVPGSGGFNAAHSMKGDIYLPPSTGHIARYAIEVKHYKDENFNSNIFKTTHSQLEKWWEQTVREAGQINSKPMLVFKKDRSPFLCVLEYGDAVSNYSKFLDSNTYCMFQKGEHTIIIFDFKTFLNYVSVEDLAK